MDTGPLVALFEPRHRLRPRALDELGRAPEPRLVCPSLLTEAFYLLGSSAADRVLASVEREVFQLAPSSKWEVLGMRALSWMQRYESSEPDFNDAFLVAWYEQEPGAKIWTFDAEFRDVWRTSRGKPIKLVA